MEFENRFTVQAPLEEMWALLLDVERIAPCMPGAQVLEQTGDASYKVAVKVKLGPMTMTYKGDVEIVEQDAAAHRATMKAKAKEARGQGTATADIVMTLHAGADGTEASILTSMQMSGKAAAMGQGVVKDVAANLTDRFADNLAKLVEDGEAAPAPEPAAVPVPEPAPEFTPVPASELTPASASASELTPASASEPAPAPASASELTPASASGSLPEAEAAAAALGSATDPPPPTPPPPAAPSPPAPPPPRPAAEAPSAHASLPVGQIAASVLKQRLRDPKTLGVIGTVVVALGLRGVRRR